MLLPQKNQIRQRQLGLRFFQKPWAERTWPGNFQLRRYRLANPLNTQINIEKNSSCTSPPHTGNENERNTWAAELNTIEKGKSFGEKSRPTGGKRIWVSGGKDSREERQPQQAS
jgi:hypothetical protein